MVSPDFDCGGMAVLPLSAISRVDANEYLSPREKVRMHSIRSPLRRAACFGARLAAKFLFLSSAGASAAATPSTSFLGLKSLTQDDLEIFPRWSYREVEVLPLSRRGGGAPRLRWADRLCPIHLSLAHSSNAAGAFLNLDRRVGFDLESPVRWSSAFIKDSFTREEYLWAERLTALGVGRDLIYTMLWSLKESALKAQASDANSVWRIPRIQIQFDCEPERLASALDAGSHHAMERLPVRVGFEATWQQAQIALRFEGSTVLTAMTLLEEVP